MSDKEEQELRIFQLCDELSKRNQESQTHRLKQRR